MPRTNFEVAAALHELADLLQINGGGRLRTLAYRRAGDAVRGLGRDVSTMTETELQAVHGIGRATAGKVQELLRSGSIRLLEELRAKYPAGVLEVTPLPGV